MTAEEAKKLLSMVLSIVLATGSSQVAFGYQAPASVPAPDSGSPTAGAPMTASELQGLVAPIALYPDQLVAQILAAATFPDQVAVANYWIEQNKNLTGTALVQAVNKQTWDASVKALTQFPSVLDNMAKNLSWTSSLGEAYHNQQSDVMTAVQTLRAQAKAAGNLKSTPQITVQEPQPQTIVIQPANPQIVYVPQYNPAVIYGTPYVTPGYSTGALVATGLLSFGAGIAVGAMMSGGGGWGWNSWGCNWHGGVVVYNHNNFYGNSAWHGGYYNGGYHNGYGYNNAYNNYNKNGYNNYNKSGNNSYNRNGDNNYNKNVSGNTVNINKQSAQSFNKQSAQNFGASHPSASNSWAQHDSSAGKSDAFSGMSGKSGESGGGWSSRADSSRGWGSMRSSGFSGGRFGGGGFGGGGFHGGGFRR